MRRIFLRCAALLALCIIANGASVKINGGGDAPVDGWRCDTGKFSTVPSSKFTSPRAFNGTGVLNDVFKSHRFVDAGDLEYKIPVPAGRYNVSLLFAETYSESSLGFRQFTIKINAETLRVPGMNETLDVFEKAGGLDKPFQLDAGVHAAVNGSISIFLGRVEGKNNPMLSGLIIDGEAADTLIGEEGATSCSPGSTPMPTAVPIPGINLSNSNVSLESCGKEVETEFDGTHFAHAVPGDPDQPYVVTDFKKAGFAPVTLDGLNSHSHQQSPNESPRIVKYKWTWKDPKNPKADENGTVTMNLPKSTENFPIGVTVVSLLVMDQFCNAALANITVTVNPAVVEGAYCYYYNLGRQIPDTVTLPVSVNDGPRPSFGNDVDTINFRNGTGFDDVEFKANSVAVRCVFFVDVPVAGSIQYKLLHSGPVKMFHAGTLVGSSDSKAPNQVTTSAAKNFTKGLQEWQVHYLRPAGSPGLLAFQSADGSVIPEDSLKYDTGTILPVVTKLSETTGSADDVITLSGSSFVNGVKVEFGTKEAATLDPDDDKIKARVPAGTGTVPVTITNGAGKSNSVSFTYKASGSFPVKFKEDALTNTNGKPFGLKKIAVLKYGPDGRLYAGATNSKIYALRLNRKLQVTKKCEKDVFEKWERAVLGIDFDPTSKDLKMYFTTSTHEWKDKNLPENIGWKNGKVKSVTMAGPDGCFNNDVADVVTGLPVSNHDHGVQAIQFIPGGRMLISVGGFTNGGVAHKALGGVPSNPLSGAIVECPTSGTDMVYTSNNPLEAQIKSGACKNYATGLRNTFGMDFHTNGNLYATDNGPNAGFGDFSTDCDGGRNNAKNTPDKLIKVEEGKCHGHPSINRGRNGNPHECAFEDPRCVKPLLRLQSSTNGVVEYRSNIFGAQAKGNLFLSKFTGEGAGRVSRVILNSAGGVAEDGHTKNFAMTSGLSIVEGPRGELIMSRIHKGNFVVLAPDYAPKPSSTFFISVLPRKGPAVGGTRTLVSGHNFGKTPSATFGGKPCTDVKVVDDDSFSCIIPPGTVGSQVAVQVNGTDGSIGKGIGSDYWYF